jgi:hypothetical protein
VKEVPRTAAELAAVLCDIFPAFRAEWEVDSASEEFSSHSLHSVYLSFRSFVDTVPPMTQLTRLARLINESVAAGGDPENAVATCFLEGRRIKDPFVLALRPLLTREAKARLRT